MEKNFKVFRNGEFLGKIMADSQEDAVNALQYADMSLPRKTEEEKKVVEDFQSGTFTAEEIQ